MHFKTEVRLARVIYIYIFFYRVKREMILFAVTRALFLRKPLICMNICPEPNNAQLVLRFKSNLEKRGEKDIRCVRAKMHFTAKYFAVGCTLNVLQLFPTNLKFTNCRFLQSKY